MFLRGAVRDSVLLPVATSRNYSAQAGAAFTSFKCIIFVVANENQYSSYVLFFEITRLDNDIICYS